MGFLDRLRSKIAEAQAEANAVADDAPHVEILWAVPMPKQHWYGWREMDGAKLADSLVVLTAKEWLGG